MEKIIYEIRPFLFFFFGLKAMVIDWTVLLSVSGMLLVTYSIYVFARRWKYRGYFSMAPDPRSRYSRANRRADQYS